jgi:hypothetical protein
MAALAILLYESSVDNGMSDLASPILKQEAAAICLQFQDVYKRKLYCKFFLIMELQ